MFSSDRVPPLRDKDREVLHHQSIDDNGPGTVLRDFETLLRHIGPEGIPVSGKFDLLPQRSLPQLNGQLVRPIKIGLQRPQLKSFPHIQGLYLLLRATGLTRVARARGGVRLHLDAAGLQSWQGLGPTERYFALLESWLFHSRPEILGERDHPLGLPIFRWAEFFRRIPAQGLQVAGNKGEESTFPYYPGLLTAALVELFGFITVQDGEPEEGLGWRIDRVFRTPLGDAMLRLLAGRLLSDEYLDEYLARWDDEPEMVFGELQSVVQPYFPEWRRNLDLPGLKLEDGAYIFKVSLSKGVWRRIAVRGIDDFDSFSDAILVAFDFDHEHLYQFTYRSRFGVPVSINHPYMDESPSTDEVQIGSIGLQPGDFLTYLYDFGDCWEFGVELEAIDRDSSSVAHPTILDTRGEAPQQYPDLDDEWDDEQEGDEPDE